MTVWQKGISAQAAGALLLLRARLSAVRHGRALLFIRNMFAFKDTHAASRFPQKSRQKTRRLF